MKRYSAYIFLIVSMALAACQKSENGGIVVKESTPIADSSAFFGKWRGDCQVWGEGEYLTSGYSYFSYSNGEAAFLGENFKTSDCSGDLYSRLKMEIEFEVEGQSDTQPETFNIAVKTTKLLQVFYDQDAVNASNTLAYCDYTDWVVGVEKNISDRSCMTGPKVGEKIYSIVRKKDNQLSFGQPDDVNNGNAPELRHKNIDTSKIFNKK